MFNKFYGYLSLEIVKSVSTLEIGIFGHGIEPNVRSIENTTDILADYR